MKKYERWQIAYRDNLNGEFRLIPNPKWAWAADPFLVEYQDTIFLFAELFLYRSERNGVIGYCRYQDGTFTDWTVTMDKHWHLSYPNVWSSDGKLYMCPETYQAEEVAIYEVEAFPNKWRKIQVLLQNDKYVDNTFMRYENKNYLLTYHLIKSGGIGELLLYEVFKDGTLSKPVFISDNMGNARPGGKIIYKDGNVIRVSQDSANGYGRGLVFSKVERVSPVYEETELLRAYPNDIKGNWKRQFAGMHTYNRCKDVEVIDLKFITRSYTEYLSQKRVRKVFLNKY